MVRGGRVIVGITEGYSMAKQSSVGIARYQVPNVRYSIYRQCTRNLWCQFLRKPLLQLCQCTVAVRDLVLFHLVHFGVTILVSCRTKNVKRPSKLTFVLRTRKRHPSLTIPRVSGERSKYRGCILPQHTKIRWPPCRHDFALGNPLKQNRLMAGTGRVGKRTDSLGRLVLVRGQQVVKTRVADRCHEPFAKRTLSFVLTYIGKIKIKIRHTCRAPAVHLER